MYCLGAWRVPEPWIWPHFQQGDDDLSAWPELDSNPDCSLDYVSPTHPSLPLSRICEQRVHYGAGNVCVQ